MKPTILVAGSRDKTPVRKRFVWLEKDYSWGSPAEYGLGPDHTMNVTHWNFYLIEPHRQDLWSRYTFRRDVLSKRLDLVFCPGVPNMQVFDRWENMFQGDEGVAHFIGQNRRNQKNLHDELRSTFIADVDGLVLNDSVLENDDRLISFFVEALADAELDFLIRPFVMQLSSSHGLKDECQMKAHVEWMLEKPLYLYEQKALAEYCNAAFRAAGYGNNVLDLQIYEPSRLLITAPPEFMATDGQPLDGPKLTRVKCYQTHGKQAINVPDIDMPEKLISRYVGGTNITRCNAGIAWTPGNVDNPTRDVYWRFAHKAVSAPVERRHEFAEQARAYCEARIRGMAKQSEGETLRRIKQLNSQHAHKWSYALRRLGEAAEPDIHFQVFDSLEDAGDKINALMVEKTAEGLRWRPTQTIIGPSKPAMDIIGGPPGVGKSYHARQGIKAAQAHDDKIIDFATPLRKLSHEVADSLINERVAPFDKVQRFDGRAHHCHEDMNERCIKVEAVGVSPRTVVCPTCPFKDDCPWPKQKLSNKTGVRVMQHAHLTSTIANLKSGSEDAADLLFIDESPLEAIGTVTFSIEPKRLIELTDRLELRDDSGRTDWSATVDAVAARKQLLEAVGRTERGRIPVEHMKPLRAVLDGFMSAERESIKAQYQIKLFELAKEADFEPDTAKAKELVAIKDSCEFFYQLARAIKASLDNGREYVIGCRVLGNDELYVQLKGDVPVTMKERPIICMDATSSDGQIERMLFSQSHNVRYHPIRVRSDNVHLTQYIDKNFSKTKLLPTYSPNAAAKRNVTKRKTQAGYSMLQQIVAVIREKSRRHRSVLVIAANQVEERMRALYKWTSNVHFEHYKNLKGINKYKDTPCLVLVGYHQIPHYELENRAEALLVDEGQDVYRLPPNRSIPHVAQWRLYYKPDGEIGQLLVQHPQHPDPVVEMLRYQEHDAECVQGLGRVRPLQRTKDNKVDITVFGTVDTGMIINEVCYWDDGFDHRDYYKSWIEEDGIVFKPQSIMTDLVYDGVFNLIGRDKRLDIIQYQKRHEDVWKTWRFYYNGDKQLCRVHVKNEQTSDNVCALIKKVCGVDVHQAQRADIATDRRKPVRRSRWGHLAHDK